MPTYYKYGMLIIIIYADLDSMDKTEEIRAGKIKF